MNQRELESIRRRLRFIEYSRLFFDTLTSCAVKATRHSIESSYQKVPDRISHFAYDLFESIRLGHIVPELGNVCRTTPYVSAPIEQHPFSRGYWYDSSRHSMVGTLLGLDINTHGARHYVIETNSNCGIRPERRRLYKTKIDPLVTNLVSFARELEFGKLIVINAGWSRAYQEEFKMEGDNQNVVVTTASYPWFQHDAQNPIIRLPSSPEKDTLYVNFYTRNSPFEFFVNDKLCVHRWIESVLQENPELGNQIAVPSSHDHLVVPPIHDERWPNLVVKVSGKGQGKSMVMLQVRDEQDALAALGMEDPSHYPKILRSGKLSERFIDKLFKRDTVIYQEFIPPRVEDGRPETWRPLIIATPLRTSLLSVHRTLSSSKVPDKCPYGLIRDLQPYLLNLCQGSSFHPPRVDDVDRTQDAVTKICRIIDLGLKGRFYFGQ